MNKKYSPDPSTWTKTQKTGLIVFSALIVAPVIISLAEGKGGEFFSDFQYHIASNSIVLALIVSSSLFASSNAGNLFKSIGILFSDFSFDSFVVREIASWVYFVGMVAFFTYFIKGLVLFQWTTIGLSVCFFLIFRILMELAITAVVTAENTSFIPKE